MTTASEAKRRMRDLIAARPALTGVSVAYGQPARAAEIPATREMVFLGAVENETSEWAALGNKRRREDYAIRMTILKLNLGPDELASEQRAAVILTEARNALAGDPTLQGLLSEGVTFEDGSLSSDPTEDPKGWLSRASCRVRCVALVATT